MDARIVDGRKIARVTDDGKLKVLVHGRDGDDLVPVKVSEDGYVELNQGAPGQNPWPVTLSGHIQEFAVASWDDLPPDSVPVGSVAMLIGTNDIRQTDGEEWLPI